MKYLRKLTALLAVMTLMLALRAPMAVSAAPAAQQEELLYFGRSILTKMDNAEALCYAYDKLVEGIANHEEEIDVSHRTYTLNWDEAATVQDLVMADHPEFFYVYTIAYGGGDNVNFFRPNYPADRAPYAPVVTHRAQVLSAGLEGKSDYEKSLILHDRICDAVTYDLNSAHNQTLISSLALGESVCAGYARAYQWLLQMVGIPCFYVVGTADNGTGIGGHAWNLVQLDGQWYYSDVTWDDQNDDGGDVYYAYLNTTYDQISIDHFAENYAEYLPRSTATAANYFAKNGLIITPDKAIDVKKAAAAFKASPSAQFYFTGDDIYEGADIVFASLTAIVRELMGKNCSYSVEGLGAIGHTLVLHWTIDHTHSYETNTVPACGGSPGTVTNHCTVCGHTEKRTLAPISHEMDWEWDETHHTYHCHHCGLVETTGTHNFVNNVCVDCGYTVEVKINYGDADGNGKVNNRDLARLQQYITGWPVTIDLAAADVDGNGKINNRDLARLQQYVTGWPVTLG